MQIKTQKVLKCVIQSAATVKVLLFYVTSNQCCVNYLAHYIVRNKASLSDNDWLKLLRTDQTSTKRSSLFVWLFACSSISNVLCVAFVLKSRKLNWFSILLCSHFLMILFVFIYLCTYFLEDSVLNVRFHLVSFCLSTYLVFHLKDLTSCKAKAAVHADYGQIWKNLQIMGIIMFYVWIIHKTYIMGIQGPYAHNPQMIHNNPTHKAPHNS